MAKKLERTYTIPLRKGILNVPKYKRAKRAVSEVKTFLEKHMKSEDIRIGPSLNEELWKNGIRNPPVRVTVTAVKEDNVVKAELEGVKFKSLKIQAKTEVATGLKGKLQGMMGSEKGDDKAPLEDLAEGSDKKKEAKVEKETKDVKEGSEEAKVEKDVEVEEEAKDVKEGSEEAKVEKEKNKP
jgi:large subunit ribosomal protein L31e